MWSFKEIFPFLLLAQGLFTISNLIPALMLGSNTYAGFNVIFLELLYVGFIVGTYYGLTKYLSRFYYGMILGGSSVLSLISLQSAIFWGDYADCVHSSSYINKIIILQPNGTGPECNNQAAMQAVGAFSVLMCLCYIAQISLMLYHKNEILADVQLTASSYRPIPSTTNRNIGELPHGHVSKSM